MCLVPSSLEAEPCILLDSLTAAPHVEEGQNQCIWLPPGSPPTPCPFACPALPLALGLWSQGPHLPPSPLGLTSFAPAAGRTPGSLLP